MQLQPEQRSRLLCRVIIFELSKFPFLSLFFLANFFEKGNKTENEETQFQRACKYIIFFCFPLYFLFHFTLIATNDTLNDSIIYFF
jgi:hypothetical protein